MLHFILIAAFALLGFWGVSLGCVAGLLSTLPPREAPAPAMLHGVPVRQY